MALEMKAAPEQNNPAVVRQSSEPLRLLSYVHLRNIHSSTGAGRVARQLTEHLALREDVDLRILADQADKARVLPLVGEPWASFRYHTFKADTSQQQARWFALNRPTAESYWPEADVVFCTGEAYVPTTKAKLVVTAHDAAYFESDAHRQGASFWRQQLKWKLLFQRLAARADLLHTVSDFSAGRLAHFFPALASRIRVVPNGVAPSFFEAVPRTGLQFLEKWELAGERFVVVPGGLHFRKNADLILQAAPHLLKQFPDLLLVVAGHCDTAYLKAAHSLGPRVVAPGFVDDDALQALYACSSAVWFPSRYEGFGMPVLEAMACGTAVIASRVSSIPEIAGEAALLAGVDAPQEHLEALCALLEQPELRKHFSTRGRARAAQFTWTNSAARLKGYLDELL